MRAAILTAYNEPLVVEEISTPAIGPHDALVHIDAIVQQLLDQA